MRKVMIPGIGGSGPEHWQTRWEANDPTFTRFAPTSWDEPDLNDWTASIQRAVEGSVAILVAHSLGCLAAVHWARVHPEHAGALFLVAVPDPGGPQFPPQADSFAGVDLASPLGVPVVCVVSDNDPYCSPESALRIVKGLGADEVSAGASGHLNVASGLGDWPFGRSLFSELLGRVS